MAELKNKSHIKRDLAGALSPLLDDALAAAAGTGANLLCAALYGSAAARDFSPGRSDINVFLVFDKSDVALMRALRAAFKKHGKKLKSNPVVIDLKTIEGSAAVFPMEFLEWKERSLVFYGENPLDEMEIPTGRMGLLIEESLRGKRLRLAQAYMETELNAARLQAFMTAALPGLVVVCRNIMRMQGAAALSDIFSMLGALESKCGCELSTIKRLLRLKGDSIRVGGKELDLMFKELLAEIGGLADYVGGLNADDAGRR